MAKLSVFNFLSANGFYKGPGNDTSWHHHAKEESNFSDENLQKDNILVFGRITYQMMESFWPTEVAAQMFPLTAKGMNEAEKIVFSRSLVTSNWNNTRIINSNLVEAIKELKNGKKDLTILGSGTIISQLAEAGLIDDYSLMFDPVFIGNGTSILGQISRPVELEFQSSKVFPSGKVLINYTRK